MAPKRERLNNSPWVKEEHVLLLKEVKDKSFQGIVDLNPILN
jgi:hypothetical protein